MLTRPFLDIHDLQGDRGAWTPISRENALHNYRDLPVAVVHTLNGFPAAAWFDDASPFLRANGPYRYDSLRYFVFSGGSPSNSGFLSGIRGSGAPSGSIRGAPEAAELEVFDFPTEEITTQEPESGPGRTGFRGALGPDASKQTITPKQPGFTEPPKTPETPAGAERPGTATGDIPGTQTVDETLPAQPEKPKESFYSLRVVDENGNPVDGVDLKLGAVAKNLEGRSENGRLRIDKVDEGVAEVVAKDFREARKAVLQSLAGVSRAAAAGGQGGGAANRLVLRAGAEPVIVPTGKDTEVILVVPPREVTVIEVVDGMFRLDSAVVLPEAETPSAESHESLSSASLFATALEFAEANPLRKLLVAGHADTSGTEGHNQVLSEDRAGNVLFCLAGGADSRIAFGDTCDARHTVADYKQILSWAAARFGFPCAPGKIDDVEFTGIGPIKAFQSAYNASRADLGVPDADELAVDGSMGPKTWRAVFDCYEAALADEVSDGADIAERLAALAELRGKLRFMDDGTRAMGFGESHPIDSIGRDGFRSQQNRRVEMLFFHEGEEPGLDALPKESEIYAPGIFRRIPIDQASPGSLAFLVTDDGGLPVPGATVEAAGPGGLRTATTDALGAGAFAALPRGIYVVKSRKADLWLDRVVVKVAPGSEARPLPSRALGEAA